MGKLDGLEFDVLITDVLMPGMSGDLLAERIRETHPDLPVVFISGYTDDVRTENLPGRLLHKPFRSKAVIEIVERVLAETAQDPPRAGDGSGACSNVAAR